MRVAGQLRLVFEAPLRGDRDLDCAENRFGSAHWEHVADAGRYVRAWIRATARTAATALAINRYDDGKPDRDDKPVSASPSSQFSHSHCRRRRAMKNVKRERRVASPNPPPVGRPGLGPLESKVLRLLWDHDEAVTVREVHAAFPLLAYTTLMTTLDRLYRKGVLTRHRRGRAFSYEPRCSRTAMLGELISGHVADALDASGANRAILSTLVRAVGRRDAALLDELDALVQAERERLKSEDP